MPEVAENYKSRILLTALRRTAFRIWGIVIALVGLWFFLTLLAPVAAAYGVTGISDPIYGFFSHVCHQDPMRSFHMLGHKFGVCSRCFGVYFGLFFGLAVYPLLRSMSEIEPLPRIWLFLAIIPMGVDWSLGAFDIWSNTFFTRFTTGSLLGFACAVFIVPALVELAQMILMKQQKRQNV
ncbi:MAG: DUF2085 domain-containing protein [Acidobacteria bacterium]|nr:DUF2085 domain-containing protein [Acidobacteriota bacterium]